MSRLIKLDSVNINCRLTIGKNLFLHAQWFPRFYQSSIGGLGNTFYWINLNPNFKNCCECCTGIQACHLISDYYMWLNGFVDTQ